ncbi:MAG: response regulator transcription factor [Salinisphaera sp.]|nr:response regulator transcription factor [Salinisphaera sp.]
MDTAAALLIDQCAMVRSGCRQALERAGYLVVADVATRAQAIAELVTHHPHLVVLELTAGTGGIDTIKRLLTIDQSIRILVFSMHDEPHIAERALQAGAHGYVAKSASVDEFLAGARTVSQGGRYLNEELALTLALSPLSKHIDPLEALTNREFEIFLLLVEGQRTGEISALLDLTPKSVTNTYLRIKRKLRARGMADLIRLAVNTGMLKRNVMVFNPQPGSRDDSLGNDPLSLPA